MNQYRVRIDFWQIHISGYKDEKQTVYYMIPFVGSLNREMRAMIKDRFRLWFQNTPNLHRLIFDRLSFSSADTTSVLIRTAYKDITARILLERKFLVENRTDA